MALTKSDKEDIAKMHESTIKIMTLMLKNVENKLDTNIAQTAKINGSVARHEELLNKLKFEAPHEISTCPQRDVIQNILNDRITSDKLSKMIKNTIIIVSAITGIVSTIVATLVTLSQTQN